jgi:hypothetical protein
MDIFSTIHPCLFEMLYADERDVSYRPHRVDERDVSYRPHRADERDVSYRVTSSC